jgi:DNA-binding transcriptional MerR regulator
MSIGMDSRAAFPGPAFAIETSIEPDCISISEMAKLHETTQRTLRFYETRGLLRPRRDGQNRQYDAESQRRFRLIIEGRRLGFTLSEIATMLGDAAGRDGADRLRISADRILGQIALLEQRYREVEQALGELRRRYYLMRSVTDDDLLDSPEGASQVRG